MELIIISSLMIICVSLFIAWIIQYRHNNSLERENKLQDKCILELRKEISIGLVNRDKLKHALEVAEGKQ